MILRETMYSWPARSLPRNPAAAPMDRVISYQCSTLKRRSTCAPRLPYRPFVWSADFSVKSAEAKTAENAALAWVGLPLMATWF